MEPAGGPDPVGPANEGLALPTAWAARVAGERSLPLVLPIRALPRRANLGRSYARVFASCVPRRPQSDRVTEPRRAELIQEGHAFLGSGYSGKPLRFGEVVRFAYSFL